jgi:diaminopimelate decarboxylase
VVVEGHTVVEARRAAYGIDEERVQEAIDRIRSKPSLRFAGVHAYFGTQIMDAAQMVAQFAHILELAHRCASYSQMPLDIIDFGGGFGVPVHDGEAPFAMELFSQRLRGLINRASRESMLAETRLISEPGRYLTAEAGLYVTRVLDVKESRGGRFVIVDGGLHHHSAAAGNLGSVVRRDFPIVLANKCDREATTSCTITGRQCTPLDTLARSARLPMPEPGDLVCIFQSGAYARWASPTAFRGHPEPCELFVEHGTVSVARQPCTFADFLAKVNIQDPVFAGGSDDGINSIEC